MSNYFPGVKKIRYEGPKSSNPLAFKHYDAKKKILGKTMAEHLRFSVCYWHTFKGLGNDPFGVETISRAYNNAPTPLKAAEQTLEAAFEFFGKLGVDYWCFHDRDIAPEGDTLRESNRNLDHIVSLAKRLQSDSGVNLLWGTACLFNHPRYMSGASTNPNPEVFAYAAAQVKKAIEVTHELGGAGYVFWGGREGYETLLNTNMERELDHLAQFLHMAVDYKKKIGFKGQFYIEPKPCEPTKHQYDFDAAACLAFLLNYDLEEDLKFNIEANHATLAGHTFHHELEFSRVHGMLGSVDANRGDPMLGWDTDQFPLDLYDTTLCMLTLLRGDGLTTGGLNFDAKVRRQSNDPNDLFYAHIGGMDCFARGLKIAAKVIREGRIDKLVRERYAGWDRGLGRKIEKGKIGFRELEKYALENGEPEFPSGQQELYELLLNDAIE
jgi:xylose isomerase